MTYRHAIDKSTYLSAGLSHVFKFKDLTWSHCVGREMLSLLSSLLSFWGPIETNFLTGVGDHSLGYFGSRVPQKYSYSVFNSARK